MPNRYTVSYSQFINCAKKQLSKTLESREEANKFLKQKQREYRDIVGDLIDTKFEIIGD